MGESNGAQQSNKIGNKLFEAISKQANQVNNLESLVEKLCNSVNDLVQEVKTMNSGILLLLKWCLLGGLVLFTMMLVAVTGVWVTTSTIKMGKDYHATDR
jgi:hypothetical protein